MLAATFDIGTTAVKAVVVNENGEAVFTGSSVIHTIETENLRAGPDEWYEAFCGLSKELLRSSPREIGAVIFRSDAGCDPGRCGRKGTWKRDPLFGRTCG